MPDDTNGETGGQPASGSGDSFKPLSFNDALKQVFSPISSRLGGRGGAGRNGGTAAPRPRARPASGSEEERIAVTYVDRRERVLGFALAGLVIVLSVVVFAHSYHYTNPKRLHYAAQVRHAGPELLAAGLVLGAIMIAAAISRRRAALGFAFLLAGVGLLQIVGIVAILYLGIGIWMVFRAMKRRPGRGAAGGRQGARGAAGSSRPAASTSTASARSSGARRPSAGSSPAAGRRAGNRTTVSRAGGRTGGSAALPPGPAASKRYTPPRPPRHPAPPKKPESAGEGGNRLTAWLRK
ncbi:MAG: hypothetical protein ACRDZ6_00840 [Acidimicrobiales bacterium]